MSGAVWSSLVLEHANSKGDSVSSKFMYFREFKVSMFDEVLSLLPGRVFDRRCEWTRSEQYQRFVVSAFEI